MIDLTPGMFVTPAITLTAKQAVSIILVRLTTVNDGYEWLTDKLMQPDPVRFRPTIHCQQHLILPKPPGVCGTDHFEASSAQPP